jgi:hypothetical protein
VTRRAAWICVVGLSAVLLSGCSFAGMMHFGDVTLALQNGFATLGSHVGFFIH